MNRLTLLKQMLPGLLPLFVFIIADEIWGTRIGLIVACAFGASELVWTWIRERRLERFILFDTGLLLLLGAISILLENDIFFKLKPALIEGLLCIILALSAFTSKNIMLTMTQHYMKNLTIELQKEQIRQMQTMTRILFLVILAHTGAIIYAAFYLSQEVWVFISGGLFYIIVGVFFIGQLVWQKLP